MVSFLVQGTVPWTAPEIKTMGEEEAANRNGLTVEERLRRLEEENRILNDRLRNETHNPIGRDERELQNDPNDVITHRTFTDGYSKTLSITSLVVLIFSVGLLLAGIFTGVFAALPLFAFIPLIAGGAVGIVASSILFGIVSSAGKIQFS